MLGQDTGGDMFKKVEGQIEKMTEGRPVTRRSILLVACRRR